MNEAFALTRRHLLAVWILLSAAVAIVGAVGPWLTASTVLGSFSFTGTYIGTNSGGSALGAGWDVITVAIVAGALATFGVFRSSRPAVTIAAIIAAVGFADTIYVMVRSAGALTDATKYASVSWGWGLIVAVLASASLLAALILTATTLARHPDAPSALSRTGRVAAVLGVLLATVVAAAVIEGIVIVHKQRTVDKTKASLRSADATIAGFPARLSDAQSTSYDAGHSAGVTDEDQKYSSCYANAYQAGYLQGWNAAVNELNTTGSVEGGATDPWWNNTTFATCDGT